MRYSFKIRFNIFLPSVTMYSKFTLSFGYSIQFIIAKTIK